LYSESEISFEILKEKKKGEISNLTCKLDPINQTSNVPASDVCKAVSVVSLIEGGAVLEPDPTEDDIHLAVFTHIGEPRRLHLRPQRLLRLGLFERKKRRVR